MVIISGILILIFAGYLTSFDSQSFSLWSRLVTVSQENNLDISKLAQTDPSRFSGDNFVAFKEFMFNNFNKRASRIETEKDGVFQVQLEGIMARYNDGHTWNWPSSILRISVISLIIFFIQILMQLYKYNSRLIAFYGSRRDALMLSSGDANTTEIFSKILMPNGLDFGRQPNSPLLEIGRFWPWRRSELQRNPAGRRPQKTRVRGGRGGRTPPDADVAADDPA